ncbi:MAG: DUF411 domain-containing protein [Burkholderiales bacterium]|nr:DUF411 domain-containing protein [Burkholderiales bacterium]
MNKKGASIPSYLEKIKSYWPVLAIFVAVTALSIWSGVPATAEAEADVVVYKSPACGCCSLWIDHLRNDGLEVRVENVSNTEDVRKRFGVPRKLGSCHTAVAGDYWIEGHVPVDLVRRLMAEKPANIQGIAVPGMSLGSPGMEGPNASEYKVMAYDVQGKTSVYATRQGKTAIQ